MILIYYKNNITEEPKIKMTALEIDGLIEIWVFSALLWKEYRRKPFPRILYLLLVYLTPRFQ
jgi:hypothetical protein